MHVSIAVTSVHRSPSNSHIGTPPERSAIIRLPCVRIDHLNETSAYFAHPKYVIWSTRTTTTTTTIAVRCINLGNAHQTAVIKFSAMHNICACMGWCARARAHVRMCMCVDLDKRARVA